MNAKEWFRKTTWSQEDREEFFARLAKVDNPFHKAQYLRIQALHLRDSHLPLMVSYAIELLNLLIEECPEPSQLAMAYLQKAECLSDLGFFPEAIQAYRESLEAQRKYPSFKTDAALSFGIFAITYGLTDLYDEILGALNEFSDLANNPERIYRYNTIKAIIADFKGDAGSAQEFAREAINASQKFFSGLHYDKETFSLVAKSNDGLYRKIKELANL
ncbi:MAG: hypothetical protein QME63_08605 [Actinomycetota bacterium]|nr:hypothetical protein [Actinomycetota bacterium]